MDGVGGSHDLIVRGGPGPSNSKHYVREKENWADSLKNEKKNHCLKYYFRK